jgi:hypothetical protein
LIVILSYDFLIDGPRTRAVGHATAGKPAGIDPNPSAVDLPFSPATTQQN